MESTLRPLKDPDFRLIETFGFHPVEGLVNFDLHLARMERSATVLGLRFDPKAAKAKVKMIGGTDPLRCRLTMGVTGNFELTTALSQPISTWRVGIAKPRLNSADLWLQHKTTERHLYNAQRDALPDGIDELLFLNEREEVCEGTITNVFVTNPDGDCFTPPLSSGVLPGVFRKCHLMAGKCKERVLTVDDLKTAASITLGNSFRGEIKAQFIWPNDA